jgi:ribose transport system substrate-binding protein
MAGPQRNGVDTAIALLQALAQSNGEVKASSIQRQIGTPRASFHRIVRTLASTGILETPRGLLRVGSFARTLIGANAQALRREDDRKSGRGSRSRFGAGASRSVEAEESGPIALSRPHVRRRSGRFKIGFSNASMSNLWRIALVHGVEYAAASLEESIERLIVLHADDNADQQTADIERMIADGVDGLIVSAVAPRTAADAIDKAMKRGIEVVFVDRGVEDCVPRTSFVTAADATIGQVTATWLAEKLDGRGAIVLLAGDSSAEPARIRLAAAQAVFGRWRGLEILETAWTGWRREAGQRIMRAALERWDRKIAGVWCDSGLQGAGSLQAFVAAGYRTGEIPPHTGGDLNLAYKLAIRWQAPLAAVDFPPSMGIKALETLLGALRGCWTPRSVKVASEVILTKGAATRSVTPDVWAEDHVRWDLPDDLVLAAGLGRAYNPRSFRIHYPGNFYNRSAARAVQAAHE